MLLGLFLENLNSKENGCQAPMVARFQWFPGYTGGLVKMAARLHYLTGYKRFHVIMLASTMVAGYIGCQVAMLVTRYTGWQVTVVVKLQWLPGYNGCQVTMVQLLPHYNSCYVILVVGLQ